MACSSPLAPRMLCGCHSETPPISPIKPTARPADTAPTMAERPAKTRIRISRALGSKGFASTCSGCAILSKIQRRIGRATRVSPRTIGRPESSDSILIDVRRLDHRRTGAWVMTVCSSPNWAFSIAGADAPITGAATVAIITNSMAFSITFFVVFMFFTSRGLSRPVAFRRPLGVMKGRIIDGLAGDYWAEIEKVDTLDRLLSNIIDRRSRCFPLFPLFSPLCCPIYTPDHAQFPNPP